MAWQDLFAGNQPGLSDDDKNQLANSGLLSAGLSVLANNRSPGTTPMQALSGGLLGGIQSAQQGGQQLVQDRYKQQQMQFQQSQMQDQQAQQQRRQKIQDLALKFAKPDGTFDMPGYQGALAQIDPQAAMELHQNEIQSKNAELQGQKTQRELSSPNLFSVDQGSNKVTYEQMPDGTRKQVGVAGRFAPQQQDKSFQFMSGPNGQLFRANPRTGEMAPVTNPDGTPFIGGGKPGAAAGGGMAGGRQGAAAQIKAFDQRNKMQQEANNGVDSAYKAAETLTGIPEQQLRGLPLDQLQKTIEDKGSTTGPGSQFIHPFNYQALGTYGTQAAMANAVLNSQGNKPTDADIKYGKDASFAPDKTLGLNAKLIRQQIERAQKAADQINTLKTQFDNNGALPTGITPGGVGIGEVPGSVNQPTGQATSPSALDQAMANYGKR